MEVLDKNGNKVKLDELIEKYEKEILEVINDEYPEGIKIFVGYDDYLSKNNIEYIMEHKKNYENNIEDLIEEILLDNYYFNESSEFEEIKDLILNFIDKKEGTFFSELTTYELDEELDDVEKELINNFIEENKKSHR